jgi:hypothetical protein
MNKNSSRIVHRESNKADQRLGITYYTVCGKTNPNVLKDSDPAKVTCRHCMVAHTE